MIGVNTAIASNSGANEGIGFSIPINLALSIVDRLLTDGRVQLGYLGVSLDSNFRANEARRAGLPQLAGARISEVKVDSPAAEAELQVDDVVLKYGDVLVENDRHLINLAGLSSVGQAVELVIFRDGALTRTTVVIGQRQGQ